MYVHSVYERKSCQDEYHLAHLLVWGKIRQIMGGYAEDFKSNFTFLNVEK